MMAELTVKFNSFLSLSSPSVLSAVCAVYPHALLEIVLSFDIGDLVLAYGSAPLLRFFFSSLLLEGSCFLPTFLVSVSVFILFSPLVFLPWKISYRPMASS